MIPELKQYYIFLTIMVVVSIGLQLVLPFPVGFIVALAVCILLPVIARKHITKRNGAGKFGGMEYGSKMEKVCMACGTPAKGKDECIRCGGKAFKYH